MKQPMDGVCQLRLYVAHFERLGMSFSAWGISPGQARQSIDLLLNQYDEDACVEWRMLGSPIQPAAESSTGTNPRIQEAGVFMVGKGGAR